MFGYVLRSTVQKSALELCPTAEARIVATSSTSRSWRARSTRGATFEGFQLSLDRMFAPVICCVGRVRFGSVVDAPLTQTHETTLRDHT